MGYEDPRFLQQKIETLERDLRDLRAKALPLAAQQKGPLPGYMRAVQINDPGLASSMWLALGGNQPGKGPYQAVTDPNNVVRAELGNLAANGNSPAQWGFRANNASGAPIFDSLGLISTLSVALDFSPPNIVPTTCTNSQQLIPGGSSTFTTTRQQSFIAFFGFGNSFLANGTAGPAFPFMEIVDPNGVIAADSNFQTIIVGTGLNGMCFAAFTITPVGTCTVNLYINTFGISSPETFTMQYMRCIVLRLGN